MVTNVSTVSPPPATRARGTAEVAALPKPAHTLISAVAFLTGACLLASAFDPNLSHGTQSLRFWCGLGVSLAAAVAVGLRPGARESERIGALVGLGVLLYLPYVLRSPEHAIFGEELIRGRSVRELAESGHTPAQFPGLEYVALWLHDTTGIGLDSLARVVPLAVAAIAPVLVFRIATAIGLNGRTGFLAAAIFLANPATFFLHSAFIPETLGILLFLAAWTLVVECARAEFATVAYAPSILACLAGIVVVDHMGALMTAVSFLVLAFVTRGMHYRRVAEAFALAVVSIVLLNGWLLLHATTFGHRLAAVFVARVDMLAATVRQEAERGASSSGATHSRLPSGLWAMGIPSCCCCSASPRCSCSGGAGRRSHRVRWRSRS